MFKILENLMYLPVKHRCSKINFLISQIKLYVVGTLMNRINGTILLGNRNIMFQLVNKKIIIILCHYKGHAIEQKFKISKI